MTGVRGPSRFAVGCLAMGGGVLLLIVSQIWIIQTDWENVDSQACLESLLMQFARKNGRMPSGWSELSRFSGGALTQESDVLEVPGWRDRKGRIRCRDFAIAFGISARDVRRGKYWLIDKEGGPLLLVKWTGSNWPASGGEAWSGRVSKSISEAMAGVEAGQADCDDGR